jgi:hypothetical protein
MIIYFPQIILIISNYSNIVTSAVQHTDKMAENRSKSQEAAAFITPCVRKILPKVKDVPQRVQGTAIWAIQCIQFNVPQVNKPQPLAMMNFGDYSPHTIVLTIATSFINLRSAVNVIFGGKNVLLSHTIYVDTQFFLFGKRHK